MKYTEATRHPLPGLIALGCLAILAAIGCGHDHADSTKTEVDLSTPTLLFDWYVESLLAQDQARLLPLYEAEGYVVLDGKWIVTELTLNQVRTELLDLLARCSFAGLSYESVVLSPPTVSYPDLESEVEDGSSTTVIVSASAPEHLGTCTEGEGYDLGSSWSLMVRRQDSGQWRIRGRTGTGGFHL